MPSFNDRQDDLGRLTELVKGAVDTAVGLGVLGLQKLQVGRVELEKRLAKNDVLGGRYAGLRKEAFRQAGHLDAVFTEARRTIEASLHPVTGRLPEPARHVATVAQARFDELHAKVSHYLASAAQAAESHSPDGPTDV
jgi:hypothetical protein